MFSISSVSCPILKKERKRSILTTNYISDKVLSNKSLNKGGAF
jgi:hypothetical protein